MLTGELDIGLIPDTIPPITQVNMTGCCVYLLIIFVSMIVFMGIYQVRLGGVTEDMEVGLKRPATLPFIMT